MKKIFFGIIISALLTLSACHGNAGNNNDQPVSAADTLKNVKYTCTMHPQVIRDKPGKCPICGMKLVPVKDKAHGQMQQPADSMK